MKKCPRLVITAVHSGSCKTSLTIALVGALCLRGCRIQTFKVGPDFLDPTIWPLFPEEPVVILTVG
jgi:cobyrinic acid a,c-diamide synthase